LSTSRLCEGLPEEVVDRIAQESVILEMGEGSVLLEDSDVADALHVVSEGEIGFLIRTSAHADYSEIARIGCGEFFGEGAVIDGLASREHHRYSRPARNARIVCRRKAVLVQVPAREFHEALREHPVLLCRNLLRSSSEKLRMGVQRTFDEVLERESQAVLSRVTRWLTRRMEDPISALSLQSGLLVEEGVAPEPAAAIGGAAVELAVTLQTLARFAQSPPRKIVWETFSLRAWWAETEPAIGGRLDARRVELRSYFEECEIESSRLLLREAMQHLVTGLGQLCPTGGRLEVKGGRHHGRLEVLAEAILPGLTDSAARRLFEPFTAHGVDPDAALALALARQSARLLGGDAAVKRRNGEQITLALTLPIQCHDALAPF
jgi:CRP-like cAMP-binding protein